MKFINNRLKITAAGIVLIASVTLSVALTLTDSLLSDHPFLKALYEKFQKHQDHYSPEKVYLHYDKTLYKPGETIWLSAYIRDARTLQASSKSDIVYVELLNPRGAIEKSIKLIAQNGQAAGDFQLSPNTKGGTYKLKAYTKWQQNTKEFFEREIQVQAFVMPNLNMKLEFERDAYGPGSNAVAQLSLETLDKQVLTNHNFSYVAKIEGKEAIKGSGKTDDKGIAKVSIDLPKGLNSNDVILNVMFNYKGQTESISRSVPVLLGNIDLQFFPEGGEMVAGQRSVIAFKAINEFGKAADIKGEIIDETGKKVSDFSSYHKGMGKFDFLPKVGKVYKARITEPSNVKEIYTLPKAIENAIGIRLRGQNRHELQIDIVTNQAEELFVVAQSNGNILFSKVFEVLAGNNPLSIPSSSFPVGISQITVFDSKQEAKAERLVFVNPHKQLKIGVKSKKEQYMPRELVEMEIEVTDEYGRPVQGQFSVAVADDKLLTFADDKQGNILAYTLLESDLKGEIEEPNFYFVDENDPKRFKPETDRKIALDHLMMTQGWSRFVWKEVQENELANSVHKGERALITGTVSDINGIPVSDAEVKYGVHSVRSNDKGIFALSGVELYNPISITASKDGSYPAYANVSDYDQQIKLTLLGKRTIKGIVKDVETKKPVQGARVTVYGNGSYYANTNVKGEYSIEFPQNCSQLYLYYYGDQQYVDLRSNKSDVIDFKVNSEHIMEIETTTASGSKIKSSRAKAPQTVVGRVEMLEEVEDMPVRALDADMHFNAMVAEPAKKLEEKVVFDQIIIDDVEFDGVEIEDKKQFSGKDRNRRAEAERRKPIVISNKYYRAREFYTPKYLKKEQPAERTDFRSTVYWNPNLKIGKDGKAKISFYNSDDITQFRVTVEGFGNNASVGRVEYKYFIQLPVELISKIPAELLTEDKVSIPVTISNNTDEILEGQLWVSLPEHLKFINATSSSVTLKPREGKTVFIEALVSKEPASGKLNISFECNGLKDELTQEIKTRPRGFPVRIAYSGEKLRETMKFNIKDPIASSVKASIKVYPNTLKQVIGGMESMLRMPGGCFEQTSSANYPNIMALNYLRETNTSNVALEKKARQFLETGYGRLTGYESKSGGFDWWGRDPAHEALTAYGLMQFIDMKTVYNVDKNMINRTIKWLLGRRNGKGSWNKNPNCLHSWASSEITDAYIVWALTEADLGKEIAKELDKSYKDAVKSEDPYLMALVINSLYNVKDNRASELMKELLKTQKTDGSFMGLNASVVNSRGNALKIETTALAALAMMKTNLYKKQLQVAMSSIHGGKDYYGYGSTQGTVLALKAITAYTRMNKKPAEKGVFAVLVNGKKVINVPYSADESDIVIPDLTPFLGEGEQKVEVIFEGAKSAMPYELSLSYNTRQPENSKACELQLNTSLASSAKMGQTVRMKTQLKSNSKENQPIVMAMIGIPAGLSVQHWQLKELQNKKVFDFYEIFDGYVVLHYEYIKPGEIREINLDLKADVPGQYEAPASCAFLYYNQQERVWSKPDLLSISK